MIIMCLFMFELQKKIIFYASFNEALNIKKETEILEIKSHFDNLLGVIVITSAQ
jgi:hypothetical protein